MAIGCPCGAEVKPALSDAIELTESLIDSLIDDAPKWAKLAWLALPWIGQLFDLSSLCGGNKPPMPVWDPSDIFHPVDVRLKFGDMLGNLLYNYACDCLDCPPITDCDEGDNCIVVSSDNGYQSDPDSPDKRYHIPTGSELWLSRSDGFCLGLSNGVWIYWYADGPDQSVGHVNVRNGNDDGPGNTWWAPDIGDGVGICFGGEQQPDTEPAPTPPSGWPNYNFPGPCSNADQCATLDKIEDMVHRIEFLVGVIAGPEFGITAPVDIGLPGLSAPISGTLATALPRALTALGPIQSSQLTNPETTPLTESSYVDVSGVAYVLIEFTTVPDWHGYQGEDELTWYYSKGSRPAPGRYVVTGETGILAANQLVWGAGTEFVVPSTASGLFLHLEPGVEVAVTTWERTV